MNVNIWILKKIKSLNLHRMNEFVNIIATQSGKTKLYIKIDIIRNFLLRGCGYTDYFRGNYVNLSKEDKDTFVTAKKFYKILDYLNDDRYEIILKDKIIFNHYFQKYINRDFLNLLTGRYVDFLDFIEHKKIIFAKKPLGEGGKGVSKIVLDDYLDKKELYYQLLKNKQYLIEEEIKQCKELNRYNPNVVSSFRVITLYKDGKVKVLNNALRMNQGVDNVIGSTNDLYFKLGKDGRICSKIVDDYGNFYKEHPLTHEKFSELYIKDINKAFETCIEAAYLLPNVRYIGWDVAFTNKGPVIVEGNEYPGYGIIQYYKLNYSKTGHLKEISDVLKNEMNNIHF